MDLATARAIANIIKHHASSTATTPRRGFVKGPRALNSLITITVAAGAVADEIAPKSIAKNRGFPSKRNTDVTNTHAPIVSSVDIQITCLPKIRKL